MAQKPIKPKLLWQVLFWVPYRYSGRPKQEREARPIREYHDGDGAKASTLIKTIRMARYYQLKAFREGKRNKPDFEEMKKLVVNSLQIEHDWDEVTRNYLSSAASTYITWDSRKKAPMTDVELEQLARYASMFYDPNGKLGEMFRS